MKKKVILVLSLIILFIFILSNKEKDSSVLDTKEVNNNMLSMMLETSVGSGEYQETTASAWPTEGYVFNENLSKCEKGSSLSWDSTKNTVVMTGNVSDRCYVYFDKEPDTVKLSDYIKSLYTNQGANNLYLHDSTLTNGAGDNSYRYAGSSDTTNNFVCFGYDSTDGTCPSDYLYRIIGVFGDNVKLIKYDYANSNLLGTNGNYAKKMSYLGNYKGKLSSVDGYYWKKSATTYDLGDLNKTNLNVNYINNLGSNWSVKISSYNWIIGGNTFSKIGDQTVKSAYQNEIINPSSNHSFEAKVGLMYVSDYGYAAPSSAWTTKLYESNKNDYSQSNIKNNNWMYMGVYEWTIQFWNGAIGEGFNICAIGGIGGTCAYGDDEPDYNDYSFYAVRPSFYLNSNVSYIGGKGTQTEPFLIK